MITSEQYEILCHTSRTGRYVADPNCNLIALRQDGLLLDHGAQRLADGMHYFTLTGKGREAIQKYREEHPEKQSKPPTLAHRRYVAFLREYGVEFEGEFATVHGYVIVDIGLRMLTPRELYRAQGFPDDYIIDRAWVVDPKTGKTVTVLLTKEQQIRMCGNSVCPQVAAALIRANNPEMIVRRFTERETRSMERMAA